MQSVVWSLHPCLLRPVDLCNCMLTFKAWSDSQTVRGTVEYHWWDLPQASFLSRQNTSFVMINVCLARQKLCRNKIVATKYFCCNKHVFVATNVLSWQAYFVTTKDMFCHDTCLSWQTRVCRDKHVFVVTKILAAAPTYDSSVVTSAAYFNWDLSSAWTL